MTGEDEGDSGKKNGKISQPESEPESELGTKGDPLGKLISKTFLERFNRAAMLARDGRYEEALKAYESIHDPFEDKNEKRVSTGEFLGMTEVRKGFCLMDLGRYKEARKIFESDLMKACVGQFDQDELYDFLFAYGNTLGNLGDLDGLEREMERALRVVEGKDTKKVRTAFFWIMNWEKDKKDWDRLEGSCIWAHKYGVENGDYYLQHLAGEFGCHAYRGQGETEKARRGAGIILERLRGAKADPDKLTEWESFLESLGAAPPGNDPEPRGDNREEGRGKPKETERKRQDREGK